MRVRLNVRRLQELLAGSGLSQNHWALKVGVSRGHWSDLVNGKYPYPSPKTRMRIAEVLGVAPDELFSLEPNAPEESELRAALFERYVIDRELGQGAMGTVYLAREAARGRLVALKVFAREAVAGVGIDSFLREVNAVSRLQHPNILPLFDAGAQGDTPYAVLPWVRGGSLRDRLRRETRLALPAAIAITRGIAAALDHAHDEFVLHCDVKPENILLHGDHAWVADFGISRIVHAEVSEWRARETLDVSAGTPAYVSPEQANGDTDLDGRSDVYSLGCVVYEMLAGRPPFEGTTTDAVVAKRFLEPPPPLRDYAPEVPGAVATAIDRAMALDRARRPPTATAFVDELAAAAAGVNRFAARTSLALSRTAGALRRRTRRPPATRLGGALVEFLSDAHATLRGLRRNWRFAAAFVVPLALGLGAGGTFFSIIDQVLLRPPAAVEDPDGLLGIAIATPELPDPFAIGNVSTAWIDYQALVREAPGLAGVAGYINGRQSLGRGEDARTVPIMLATASYFPLLGVRPQLGRFYAPDEDMVTSRSVPCVAGDRFWRAQLGASAQSLGTTVTVGSLTCRIVGVAPAGFNGIGYSPVDLYIPLRAGAEASQGDAALWNTDGSHWMRLIARARPGQTVAALEAEATRAYRSVGGRRRDPGLAGSMKVERLLGSATGRDTQRLRLARWLVGGAVALLLLVGANLANLLMARSLGRARETAIRLALGGSRGRLFRHYLVECAALALLAAGASLLVVAWGGPLARSVLFPGVAFAGSVMSGRVGLVALAVSLLVGVTIAAVTAVHATSVDPATLLNAAGGARGTATRGGRRARMMLVGVQAALSVVLLVASAGFIRSFRGAAGSDLGYDINGVVFAEVPHLGSVDSTWAGQLAFYQELRARLAAMPGVEGASLGYMSPWFYNRNEELHIPGRDSVPLVPFFGSPAFDAVTPDYLATMRLTMVAGRWIAESDGAGSAPVMVISESMARFLWPGEASVLGRCIQVGEVPACREIVGVVHDIRFSGKLDDAPTPFYYLPVAQAAAYESPVRLFIRVSGDPQAVIPSIRRMVQGARPGLPAADVHAIQDQLDRQLASWRLGAMAFTALGAVAAAVALLGLFSIMARLVAERRPDFAIRRALGAQAGHIVWPVLGRALLVIAIGTVGGLVLAGVAAHWIQPLLYHVPLMDPPVIVAVTASLALAALVAALGPARKAGTADPMEALRAE